MGAVVTKGPGLVTIGLGVAKTSLAGQPTIMVIITRGTLPSLLPLLKVGIQQQGAAVGQTNSSRHISNVIPAGLGQALFYGLHLLRCPLGLDPTFIREGVNKIL